MAVLKPRNRLVYFRISEDEFQKVAEMCQVEGARSLSDFARSAMQRLIRDGSENPDLLMKEKLLVIDEIIAELNRKLQQLTQLLEIRGHEQDQNPARSVNGGD
jgi:hypothetical protein